MRCLHCESDNVIWDCDYSFEDVGYEGDGVVHTYHCPDCGAEMECLVSYDKEEENK